jgi:hypothetical protein
LSLLLATEILQSIRDLIDPRRVRFAVWEAADEAGEGGPVRMIAGNLSIVRDALINFAVDHRHQLVILLVNQV